MHGPFEELGHEGSRLLKDMLGVVQHEEHPLSAVEPPQDRVEGTIPLDAAKAHGLCYRERHRGTFGDTGEVDEYRMAKAVPGGVHRGEGYSCLPDATGPGERYEAARQEGVGDSGEFGSATDEAARRRRETSGDTRLGCRGEGSPGHAISICGTEEGCPAPKNE